MHVFNNTPLALSVCVCAVLVCLCLCGSTVSLCGDMQEEATCGPRIKAQHAGASRILELTSHWSCPRSSTNC